MEKEREFWRTYGTGSVLWDRNKNTQLYVEASLCGPVPDHKVCSGSLIASHTPDFRKLVLLSDVERSGILGLLDLDAKVYTRLLERNGFDEWTKPTYMRMPVISANGKRIAYVSEDRRRDDIGRHEVYLFDVPSGTNRVISGSEPGNWFGEYSVQAVPSISNDGMRVAYLDSGDQDDAVFLYDDATKKAQSVFRGRIPGVSLVPHMTGDGKHIVIPDAKLSIPVL